VSSDTSVYTDGIWHREKKEDRRQQEHTFYVTEPSPPVTFRASRRQSFCDAKSTPSQQSIILLPQSVIFSYVTDSDVAPLHYLLSPVKISHSQMVLRPVHISSQLAKLHAMAGTLFPIVYLQQVF